ncbi:hypothetical protein BH23ACI1_BH23ACI1_22430 [soil metagenome]|nr:vitamin K epoxide reductase family protein [Acidobacteriota bacterium]
MDNQPFGLTTPDPQQLSDSIRHAGDGLTQQRRRVVALSLTAAGCMGLIALYQIGAIKHLPEPPLPLLDADKVDASAEAYARLSVGDAFIGFASYSVTALLAGIGGPRRHVTDRWLPWALAAKVGFDAAQAAKLTVDQWTKHRAFCSWCLVAAGATFAAVPAAWPELRATLHQRTP